MTKEVLSGKSIPLSYFNQKESKFELYWPKFEAYANLKGFSESIQTTMDSDLPAVESVIEGADDDTKKLQRRAVARNKLAIACFTMSFKTTALMNCISDAKTNNYPGGLAHLIVKGLLERYRPTGRISKLEALSELEHITMENNDEPDNLFNKIASVKH